MCLSFNLSYELLLLSIWRGDLSERREQKEENNERP